MPHANDPDHLPLDTIEEAVRRNYNFTLRKVGKLRDRPA